MAEHTTNLNLEKPAGNENFRRQVLNDNMDKIDAAVGSLSDKLQGGVKNTVPLDFGMNRIHHTGAVEAWPEISFTGKHYVNLLGKDGDCEDVGKWAGSGATISANTMDKVYGAQSAKFTGASTNSHAIFYKAAALKFTQNKYYFMSAFIKIETAGNGSFGIGTAAGIPDGGGLKGIVTSASFIRSGFKFQATQPSATNLYPWAIANPVVEAISIGSIDGIMINEISAADYALSDAELLAKYPYIESYADMTNPYFENRRHNLVRNGNCEEGTGWWTPNDATNVIAIENGKFKITTTPGSRAYYQYIAVKANTNYCLFGNVFGLGYISINDMDDTVVLKNGVGTFNTDNHLRIKLYIGTTAAGIGYIDSIMLIEGTTAPTKYKSCDIQRFAIEGQFTDDDTVTIKDGKLSGQLWWKHRTLYGKDYDWQFEFDAAGYKRLTIPKPLNALESTNSNNIAVVKYDGKILLTNNISGISASDQAIIAANSLLYVSIADTDSGWIESTNPNDDEAKVFMNGWKAINNFGPRYLAWVSVVDESVPSGAVKSLSVGTNNTGQAVMNVTPGTGTNFPVGRIVAYKSDSGWRFNAVQSNTANSVTFTANLYATTSANQPVVLCDDGSSNVQLLAWCKNNVAPGYEGYRLHYKLANPEPITDTNVHVHGDIWGLVPGDNYVTVDSGIVLDEVANPALASGRYQLNLTNYSPSSEFRNKTEEIFSVKKNGIDNTSIWEKYRDSYAYGKERLAIWSDMQHLFDPNATYTVDYQILKTLHAQSFGSLAMQYAQDVFSAISTIGKGLEDKQQKDSALGIMVDLSMYEEIQNVEIWGRFVNHTANFVNGVLIQVNISLIPKRAVPVFEFKQIAVYCLDNAGNLVGIDLSQFRFRPSIVTGYNFRKSYPFCAIYIGGDAVIRGYLLNNGVLIRGKLTADCRGRI